jgi:hypothetical protein
VVRFRELDDHVPFARQPGHVSTRLHHVAGQGDAGGTAALFHAVNVADTIKLILLGLAIAAASRMAAAAGAWPTWLRVLGLALLPILIVGGLAFVIDSGALSAVLTVSLLLLLVWVGTVSVTAARASRAAARA